MKTLEFPLTGYGETLLVMIQEANIPSTVKKELFKEWFRKDEDAEG